MDTHERLLEVETLVSPVLNDHGLTLVDLEWRREGYRWVLRFFVDKAQGIHVPGAGAPRETVSIADCQRFSQEIGDFLDASGLFPESYDLEISSPGLDRELKKEREFRWATGKTVRCWVSRAVGGRTEFTGQLKSVTGDFIGIEGSDGQLHELPRRLVNKARLEPELARRR